MSVTVFANFKIDSLVRFERLKLSFNSFCQYEFANWVINIRGKYKKTAYDFLTKNIPNYKLEISVQEYSKNWFKDTQKIFHKIKGEYIFYWNEDHINTTDIINFKNIISEIKEQNIDQFKYSWFHNGNDAKIAKLSNFIDGKNILHDNYTYKKHILRLKISDDQDIKIDKYIISLTCIFKKVFFKKILFSDDPFIKRWGRDTPFDFEKCSYDIHWLPFKIGFPKKEFFASIDDNHGEIGYSLVDRGFIDKTLREDDKEHKKKKNYTLTNLFLFPIRISRVTLREIINYIYSRLIYFLKND